jgi:hypothetical protein
VIITDEATQEGHAIMIRTTLIALAAAGAAALALAPSAQAKSHIDINVGIGLPVSGVYADPGPVYVDDDYGYDDDGGCYYVKVKHKKWKPDGTKKVWFTKELVCG